MLTDTPRLKLILVGTLTVMLVTGCSTKEEPKKVALIAKTITSSEAIAIAKKLFPVGGRYDYSARQDGKRWHVFVSPYVLDERGRHASQYDSDIVVVIDMDGKVVSSRRTL